MNKIRMVIVLSMVLFFSLLASSWATDINRFSKESYQKILDNNKNRPFLLAVWSIDCPPCYEELHLLGDYLKTHPEFKIILLSTDSSDQIDEIKQILSEARLQEQEQWLFSDAAPAQLRYAIDPLWYGELPRSYFFNHCQQRKAISGKLEINKLEALMSSFSCQQ